MLRGVIFDLDGTLVESHLDFDRIRREMNLPKGVPVLEALQKMRGADAARCREILERHEEGGARRATAMPGVNAFLRQLDNRGLSCAVVTRNSRLVASAMLTRLDHPFEPVITRDDGPVKPDPWAIWQICEAWEVSPPDVAVIGDFRFDIEAGRRAGAKTVFFTRRRDPVGLPGADRADLLLRSFFDTSCLLSWLEQDGLGPAEQSC